MTDLLEKNTSRVTLLQAARDAIECLRRMPDVDGAFRITCLKQLQDALKEEAPKCIYPKCPNSRRTRGLCHQHYQTMRSYVRLGKADEADLMTRKLLLPEGTGGSPVEDHSAFLKGSTIRGEE
jgi:hypothetical protein